MSRKRSTTPDIEDAVQFFLTAKVRLKYKGNDRLQSSLEKVENRALTYGLQPKHISQLLDVASSGIQVITVSRRLMKALIPATIVPESAVVKAISLLCTRKLPISIQCLLLRWVLVVYEHIDQLDNVHALYGILFHFLHYRTLMPYVCHLLFLLTRKEDVKLFRVRQLIQYQKDLGNQPYLTGLLSIYRHYYPKLVHVVLARTYKSFFPTYDKKWCEVVRQVQDTNNPRPGLDTHPDASLSERLQPTVQTNDLMPSRKRRRMDPIPFLHNQSLLCKKDENSLRSQLGLDDISFCLMKDLKEVQENMERIQFPSQIGSVLRSRSLQHLMSYSADPVAATRFQFWLSETLDKELLDYNKKKDKSRITRILQLLNGFSDFLQEGVPVVDHFIASYLQRWNGVDFCSLVLKLLSKCHVYTFERFSSGLLEPLRQLFFMSSVYFKCKVLLCFKTMLQHFAANELPRFREGERLCLFESLVSEECDPHMSIRDFILYVCRLSLVALVSDKCHPLLEYCILDFLELVSGLGCQYNFPFIVLGETILYERLLISPNPVTISRLCQILCRYKTSYGYLRKLKKTGQLQSSSQQEVGIVLKLNHLIRLFCNCLWRNQAFSLANEVSVFMFDALKYEPWLNEKGLKSSFGLAHHPAFSCWFVDLEENKDVYLTELSSLQLDGPEDVVKMFIKSKPSLSSTQMSQVSLSQTQVLEQTTSTQY